MIILSLDLATQTGYAHGDINKPKPKYGTIGFHDKKWDGAGVRYLKFKQWLVETIKENHIDLVTYEGVRRHTGTDAAHVYGGWVSILQAECERLDVPYSAYGVTEIKKYWTGKGNAKKDAMMSAAYDRGLDPPDDNAADALAIWFLSKDSYSEL